MIVHFLGTAAAEGYPDAFCNCDNCNAARLAGGRSHRLRSSLLINDELLIDFGPDLLTASMSQDVPLHSISFGLQTHPHEDHLDKLVFFARNRYWDIVGVNPVEYFCAQSTIDQLNRLFGRESRLVDFNERQTQEAFNVSITTIVPWQEFRFGHYRVQSIATDHDAAKGSMVFAVEDGSGARLFYGTDTGPLPSGSWERLENLGWSFNLIVLDHTSGFGPPDGSHLNADQFVAEIDLARWHGLIADGAKIFAAHIAHRHNPPHEELVRLTSLAGYAPAYDGLRIEILPTQRVTS